jgi:hypothetical protein
MSRPSPILELILTILAQSPLRLTELTVSDTPQARSFLWYTHVTVNMM